MGLACERNARLPPFLRALFFSAVVVAGVDAFARFEPGSGEGVDGSPPIPAGTEATTDPWDAKAFTSATPAVSSHTDFTLALSKDGKVYAWGWDTRGQLGRNRKILSATPQKIAGLPVLVHMDAGPVHVAAVDTAGNVWTWGQDTLGQLGPRATNEWTRPGRVLGVTGVRRVEATFGFTAALRLDGTVSVWGAFAQQGGPPRPVVGLTGITEIRAGGDHLVALKSDKTVWTVGSNSAGQLGDGTSGNYQAVARQVPGLANIVKIAAGACSSMALRQDGVLFAWGEAACGYSSAPRYSPQIVSGLAGVADISGGSHYSHAALTDGTVRYWDNDYLPTVRSGFSNVAQLYAESVFETVVLTRSGTVAVFGDNEFGQHGLGNTTPVSGVTAVPGLSGISFVSSSQSGNGGLSHFAMTAGGDLYGWGSNYEGQLALGDSMLSSVPEQVAGLPPIVRISAGDLSAYALDSNGVVWAWGDNLAFQLGDGTRTPRSVPVQVTGISGVVDVAAGRRFVLFVKSDGTVWIIGTPMGLSYFSVPQQVPGLAGIVKVAARYGNAYAIRNDGKVFAWGRGFVGMIGDGTTTDRPDPVMLTAFNSPVTMIAVGQFHVLARTADGGVWSWGSDFGTGTLGDGISGSHNRLVPARVANLASSATVAAGYSHSLAMLANGKVFSWGSTALGDGTVDARNVPGPVRLLTNTSAIAAGDYASFAVGADGLAYAWGGGVDKLTQFSTFGATTGDGTFVYRQSPVLVIRDGAQGNLDAGNWYLDLDATAANAVPPSLLPRIVPVATASLTDQRISLRAGINFRSADIGKNVGTYIFGHVPPAFLTQVKIAPSMNKRRLEALLKADEPILVQLTPEGWTTMSDQLIALTSGVISGNGAASNILNGANLTAIPGARFCIGYGESASSMLTAGTMGEVLALQGVASTVSGAPCALTGLYMSGAATSLQGSPVSFTATLVGFSPTGSVQFKDGTAALGAPLALASGSEAVASATLTTNALAVGTHSIGAEYSGDAQNPPAAATIPVVHTVSPAATGSSVALSGPVSSVQGQAVALSATVTGNSPTGTVQFKDGGTNLGSPVALFGSTATLSVATLGLGAHTITAVYSGDTGTGGTNLGATSSPLAHTVYAALATSVQLASSANPATAGSPVTFTATVSGTSPIGSVSLREGAALLATQTLSGGVATFVVPGLAAGLHVITADYGGDGSNAPASSDALFQEVTLPTVFLPVTVTRSGAGSGTVASLPAGIDCGASCSANFLSGSTVTLTATPSPGSVFVGWFGACSGSAACVLPMGAAATVTAIFEIAGTGVNPVPASLAFGGQSMNTTAPEQAVTVTNATAAPLTLTGILVSAGFNATHNCTGIAAGATCTVYVTFTPASEGALSANLALFYSQGGQTRASLVSVSGTGERSLVTHYYRSILRRAPDAGGKAFWEGEAARVQTLGASVNEVWFAMAGAFYTSAEYLAFARDNTGFITDLYNTFFNRAPDAGGFNFWTGQLVAGMPREVALVSFMFSAEFVNFTQAIFGATTVRAEINTVVDFYRGLLARLPDDGGFSYWVQQFRTAQCQGPAFVTAQAESISSLFALSPEYAARARSTSQYVGDLYNAFLRRGGDLAGVLFWISEIASGARSRENVRQQFVASPEFQNRVAALISQGCLP